MGAYSESIAQLQKSAEKTPEVGSMSLRMNAWDKSIAMSLRGHFDASLSQISIFRLARGPQVPQ